MTSKTAEKKGTKKAAKTNGSKSATKMKATQDTPATTMKDADTEPTAQTDGGPASSKPTESQTQTTNNGTPQLPNGGDEIVVFAFRLLRSERDAIHAAAGSAKASKFVRAVALAAARRDTTALQTAIQEAEANRSK